MSEQSRSKAAGYRKRAQEARDVAHRITLKEARDQLV